MSPVWYAAVVGVRRGWTELRQTFTTGQDVFGYVLWTVLLIVPLFLVRDDPLKGAGISAGARQAPLGFELPGCHGKWLLHRDVDLRFDASRHRLS